MMSGISKRMILRPLFMRRKDRKDPYDKLDFEMIEWCFRLNEALVIRSSA
jgi:hypothetical protein